MNALHYSDLADRLIHQSHEEASAEDGSLEELLALANQGKTGAFDVLFRRSALTLLRRSPHLDPHVDDLVVALSSNMPPDVGTMLATVIASYVCGDPHHAFEELHVYCHWLYNAQDSDRQAAILGGLVATARDIEEGKVQLIKKGIG